MFAYATLFAARIVLDVNVLVALLNVRFAFAPEDPPSLKITWVFEPAIGPVGPCGPCGPCGPSEPTYPFAPAGPCGP